MDYDREHLPRTKWTYVVVLLTICGWFAGVYGLVLLNGGHFHGAYADVVVVAWSAIYWTAVWNFLD